jgi:hypothetical protein
MIKCTVKILLILCLLVLFAAATTRADDESIKEEKPVVKAETEKPFLINIPDGFQPEASDERGILRWRKNSAEICAVIGEVFADSKNLIDSLQKGAEKNARAEEVVPVKIAGAQGFIFKEKKPEDPDRVMMWRLVVVSGEKMIGVDFLAPAKDFDAAKPDFESALKSFELKKSS